MSGESRRPTNTTHRSSTATEAQPPAIPPANPGTEHDIGVTIVQPDPVGFQRARAPSGLVDEVDVTTDQPPPKRRQVRMHPHETVRGIAGIHPPRPGRTFEHGRNEHHSARDLRETGVELQKAIYPIP